MKLITLGKIPAGRHVCGFLQVDLMIGLAILSLAIMPLGLSFAHERQVLKLEYYRSVANEIIDGEMEILTAGDWKSLPDGSQIYKVQSRAAGVLPPGHFQLTKNGNHLKLEWQSSHSNVHEQRHWRGWSGKETVQ